MLRTDLSTPEYTAIGKALKHFQQEMPHFFEALFTRNEPISYTGEGLKYLEEVGFVVLQLGYYRANYAVFHVQDLYIVTDTFLTPQTDRVFPLSGDESLYLANKIQVQPGSTVLDLGTGSGLYAVVAARSAKHVIAVDINSKALRYAAFNARLNNVASKIEFIQGHLFDLVPDNLRFDLIISNPAIIPTPPASAFYTHSDGGPTGTSMSFEILEGFQQRLTPAGKLMMLATSFISSAGHLILEEYLCKKFADTGMSFSLSELYNPALHELARLTDNFNDTENYAEWTALLKRERYISLHYLLLSAQRMHQFEITRGEEIASTESTAYNGHWSGRLARLFRVYADLKANKKKHALIER